MSHLGFHSKKFADKVKAMSQTGKPNLILSADEARNLLHDIFALQSHIVELSEKTKDDQVITVSIDNGKFK
jgi:hypothetical protein